MLELGEGSPVLLVHGHDGAWQVWLENIPDLAQRHRVIALDLPGFGSSPLPTGGAVSIERYAAVLAQLCAQLDLGSLAVVGHSMGGLISAELALTHPALVTRLVLVAPAGVADRYLRIPVRVLVHPRMPRAVLQRASHALGARSRTLARRRRLRRIGMGAAARDPARIAPDLAALVIGASGGAASAAAGLALASHEIRSRLPAITAPTLIIWGESDRMIAASNAQALADAIPASRLKLLADTGHLPMLERPGEFNALLSSFLSR